MVHLSLFLRNMMESHSLEVYQVSKMLAEFKMGPSLTNEISNSTPEFNNQTAH